MEAEESYHLHLQTGKPGKQAVQHGSTSTPQEPAGCWFKSQSLKAREPGTPMSQSKLRYSKSREKEKEFVLPLLFMFYSSPQQIR